jgi:hypothetical protein
MIRNLMKRLGFVPDELNGPRLVAERSTRTQRRRSHPRRLAPGRDPVGSRDPRVCLGIGRPPKTPLNDVEPERSED